MAKTTFTIVIARRLPISSHAVKMRTNATPYEILYRLIIVQWSTDGNIVEVSIYGIHCALSVPLK